MRIHTGTPAPRRDRKAWVWPAILIGLLATHAAVWLGFATIAVRDRTFSVEPDHYRKSLAWDSTSAELRRSRELGWTAEFEMDANHSAAGTRRIVCQLRDREGKPVENAGVELEAFAHARGMERLHVTLADEGGGAYAAMIPMRRSGLWELRMTARRAADTFRQVVLHEVPNSTGDAAWKR